MNKKISIPSFLLAISSGILLYLSWPNINFFPLLFIAFIPLLFSLKKIIKSKHSYLKGFLLIILTYIVWIALSLSWLKKSSPDSYLLAIFLISINYSLILSPFTFIYKKLSENFALVYFVCAILVTDWISQKSFFSTPYFNLGLGLGETPWLIQHYKWIGIEGGTLWIILCNLFFFKIISQKKINLKNSIPIIILLLIIPALSIYTYLKLEQHNNKTIDVVIHHPCFNPNTKNKFENPEIVIDRLFENSFKDLKKDPDILVWPETAIIRLGWIHKIDHEPLILYLKNKLTAHPKTTIIFGAIAFSNIKQVDEKTAYSSYSAEGDYHYNTHNLSVAVSLNQPTSINSKEIFIPFHERIPYFEQFPYLSKLVKSIGTRTIFSPLKIKPSKIIDNKGNSYKAVLCYESLFSTFMAKKAESKIGAILILTNEHWMKTLNGSKQYLSENIAIAIQGGKPIIRSSNCGVSAIINTKGKIISSISGKKNQNIINNISLNYKTTFYSKIAGLFYALGIIISIFVIFLSFLKKK